MTTFEKAAMLVVESADKMDGVQIISRKRLLETKKVIEYLECLSEVFGGEDIKIDVDTSNLVLLLSLTLPDIVCQNAGDEFFHDLVSLTDNVKFYRSDSGDLTASFQISNLWSN